MTAVLRFAPSPNGRLHLGHAYSALLNAALAKQLGGRFLLRMEDIDPTRCTEVFARGVLEDLTWLGLVWEEPVRVQSQHMDDYRRALDGLHQKGLRYPCFCSRAQVAAVSTGTDPDGAPLYPGTCRNLPGNETAARIAAGEQHSMRLDMQKALRTAPGPYFYTRFRPDSMEEETVETHPQRWGDVILARKETPTSYHLSVVVDDALQQVTHVVRGRDLEAATDLHVLLQTLLGLPTPLYHHHTLLEAPEGGKLSKSKNHPALADVRMEGRNPEKIRDFLLPATSQ